MRSLILTALCVVAFGPASNGQNLVPNWSFESYQICPNLISQIQFAAPWFNARIAGPNGPGPTPDYFNACAFSIVDVPVNSQGNQEAQDGDAYAGVVCYLATYPNFREYIEVQLTSILQAGVCYELSFFMSLGDEPTNSTLNGLGAYFSNTMAVQGNGVMNVTPQIDHLGAFMTDSLGWLKVSGTYQALGGERYLTIGNFHDDEAVGITQIHSSIYSRNCYFYIDAVALIDVECTATGQEEVAVEEVGFYPNPASDELTVEVSDPGAGVIELFNATGRSVLRAAVHQKVSLDISSLPAGSYTCVVRSEQGKILQRKRIIKL